MQVAYECQICKHLVEDRPPEWCPKCDGHRVIFKRFTYSEEDSILVNNG